MPSPECGYGTTTCQDPSASTKTPATTPRASLVSSAMSPGCAPISIASSPAWLRVRRPQPSALLRQPCRVALCRDRAPGDGRLRCRSRRRRGHGSREPADSDRREPAAQPSSDSESGSPQSGGRQCGCQARSPFRFCSARSRSQEVGVRSSGTTIGSYTPRRLPHPSQSGGSRGSGCGCTSPIAAAHCTQLAAESVETPGRNPHSPATRPAAGPPVLST